MSIAISSASILSAYWGSSTTSTSSTTFSSIDADGDEAISKDELSTYLAQATSSSGYANSIFSAMDTDGDDSVSQDEYDSYSETRGRQLALVLSTQQMMADLQLTLLKSIDGGSSSSTSGMSILASNTTASILSAYAENMSSSVTEAVSSIDVEA